MKTCEERPAGDWPAKSKRKGETMTITKVNYWQTGDREYYAAWDEEGFDHNGDIPLGVDPDEYLASEFPGADIAEVPDQP